MKKLKGPNILLYFIIALLILNTNTIGGQVSAQQAKAYENVHYTARKNNLVFYLDYADGYIGASRISLRPAHGKTQVFLPESGVPDAGGNFILLTQSATDKGKVILANIDEGMEAPKTIHAIYSTKGQNFNLLFTRTKK